MRKFAFVSAAFGRVSGAGSKAVPSASSPPTPSFNSGKQKHGASRGSTGNHASTEFPEGALAINSLFLESELARDGVLAPGDRIVAVNGRFGCAVPKWGRAAGGANGRIPERERLVAGGDQSYNKRPRCLEQNQATD